jgi:hypothetical protein
MIVSPTIAYVIEPRFPGGTSSAIAEELKATSRFGNVVVHAVSSQMFGDRPAAPQLQEVLNDLKLHMVWDAPQISADVVILHNPSFLRFQHQFETRIVTRHLIAVTHENFLRPDGHEGHDVAKCLNLIDKSSLALRKSIAPISQYNRTTVNDWLCRNPQGEIWDVLGEDWFNICDFDFREPSETPRDRRGRHSRPGFEKFPSLADMDVCFPKHASANVILGAEPFLNAGLVRPHWQAHPFRGIEVEEYFSMIDFMVYYTAPTSRESFGRVLAEGIAAGKVVVSDSGTASNFDGAVIPSMPQGVERVITELVSDPEKYRKHVEQAQSFLRGYSADRFAKIHSGLFVAASGAAA